MMNVLEDFSRRHLGVTGADREFMLNKLGYSSMDDLMDAAVPAVIRNHDALQLPVALSETGALAKLRDVMGQNQLVKSFIDKIIYFYK